MIGHLRPCPDLEPSIVTLLTLRATRSTWSSHPRLAARRPPSRNAGLFYLCAMRREDGPQQCRLLLHGFDLFGHDPG